MNPVTQVQPWLRGRRGYLLLEWVLALACLTGFILLVMALLSDRRPQLQQVVSEQQTLAQQSQQHQLWRSQLRVRHLLQLQFGELP